jgi:hypothetical protein
MKTEWNEPELQTVASWGDLAVLVICLAVIVATACGWLK